MNTHLADAGQEPKAVFLAVLVAVTVGVGWIGGILLTF
jgi:hypothetical protein